MSKQISDLVVGDTAFMFGGHRGPAEGAEVVVVRVGRIYLYVRSVENRGDRYAPEYKFERESGREDGGGNYRRYLVLDREDYIARQAAKAKFERLRRNMGLVKPEGVTVADVEAAAALLRIDLKVIK